MAAGSCALLCVLVLSFALNKVKGQEEGVPASVGEFPWQAGLYRKVGDGKWKQACGAALIHPRLLLTAAHCVLNNLETLQPEDLMVKLGQLDKDYYKNESSTVTAQVKKILVPERYLGPSHGYALNIALIELTDNVKVTDKARPTRIDWQSKVELHNGQRLKVAGWNQNANTLKKVNLKYLDFKSCQKKVPPAINQFLAFDKFCVETEKETDVKGFSGGAISVVQDELDYIVGIMALRLSGGSGGSKMFAATDLSVGEHRQWLQQQLKSLGLLEETLNWSSSTEYKAPAERDISGGTSSVAPAAAEESRAPGGDSELVFFHGVQGSSRA